MEAARELLVVGSTQGNAENIIRNLKNSGWQLIHFETKEAESYRGGAYEVGLAVLDGDTIGHHESLERLISGSDAAWVAITDARHLEDTDFISLLTRLFFAYHVYPVAPEKLHALLESLADMVRLSRTCISNMQRTRKQGQETMVGHSRAMQTLNKVIRKVASVDAPVCIIGESGTGKELTARAIHQLSSRSSGHFNAINCGAIPKELVQTELFGHEKGAFTGANQTRIGHIEKSHGGTLLLDEIGDLPIDMQVNLLRFLETQSIQRIGASQEIFVDVRILAATHIDLESSIQEGRFREDLYHRLNVLQVKLPPLRERREDIVDLANFFFHKFRKEGSRKLRGLSKQSLDMMLRYDWPGNVRELVNRVRRAVIMCEQPFIQPDDLDLGDAGFQPDAVISLEAARDQAERQAVEAALLRNSFNVKHAAKELRTSRVTLYRLMEKHSLSPKSKLVN
ncbi:sigma-54-dependent Fis family transcriptional regulator [Billgrantia azerbaijanica]|nr:sigma-54-dependent Fis family transcriptional regulator [Halomonas azerbaijanica]